MKQNCGIKIAILGLGNELLRDDGIGIHAIRALQKQKLKGVILAQIGTAALRAQLILVESDFVIAIDSIHYNSPPGTIYSFDAEDQRCDQLFSLHDLGIIGALKLLPKQLQPKVTIIGIEPQIIGYGLELSETVKASLPKLIELVTETIEKINNEKLIDPPTSIVRN
jgi:hydrogenase maturation protease